MSRMPPPRRSTGASPSSELWAIVQKLASLLAVAAQTSDPETLSLVRELHRTTESIARDPSLASLPSPAAAAIVAAARAASDYAEAALADLEGGEGSQLTLYTLVKDVRRRSIVLGGSNAAAGSAHVLGETQLLRLSALHSEDARDQGRAAARSRLTAGALFVTSLAIIASAGILAPEAGALAYWAPFGLLALLCAIGSIAMWLNAGRYERNASESSVLARQIVALGPFLTSLSPDLRELMQASLAPRLFARPVGDDDPLREPLWPSSDNLLAAIEKGRRR